MNFAIISIRCTYYSVSYTSNLLHSVLESSSQVNLTHFFKEGLYSHLVNGFPSFGAYFSLWPISYSSQSLFFIPHWPSETKAHFFPSLKGINCPQFSVKLLHDFISQTLSSELKVHILSSSSVSNLPQSDVKSSQDLYSHPLLSDFLIHFFSIPSTVIEGIL